MCYFEEPELKILTNELKQMFLQIVKNVNVELIPKLTCFPLGTVDL